MLRVALSGQGTDEEMRLLRNVNSSGPRRTLRSLRVPLLVVAGFLVVPAIVLGVYQSPSFLTTPESLLAECNGDGALVREGNTIVNGYPGPAGGDASVTARGCAYLHIGLGDWSACRHLPVDRPGVPCRKGMWTVTFDDYSTGDVDDSSTWSDQTTFTYGL